MMLRYVYADDIHHFPRLADSMFRDRADQFATRLGWDVQVDGHGHERDDYDALNPLYVIWEGPDGRHRGSMRFLPTTGRTMINEHFTDVLGGGELMRHFEVRHFAGVFDERMVRIYRLIGASPEVLGSRGEGRERVSIGLWAYTDTDHRRVSQRARVSLELSDLWFRRSFGFVGQDMAQTA